MTDAGLYPSYVDLDPFIDTARLRSLDGYITERLERRLAEDLAFYTGPFLLDGTAPHLPGSKLVYLSRSSEPENYYDVDRTDLWRPSEEAGEFAELMAFIDTLPFKAKGRMIIMYDREGSAVSAHRDHDSVDLCHEFVWFRTNLDKPFYMLNPHSGEKLYVHSHAAWFDTVNQYHGGDATGALSFSIRVDGIFTDEFRSRIPFPAANRASAPALWAERQAAEA
ncbi:MAG: hypothetical protein E6G94_01220 [Alphaproteobacteria bacterium]|nr:MAG: hypothetical protein E6G94_01220 [Alphaproteobacteria bacterium]